MKNAFLFLLLFFHNLLCFSQNTRADSLQELKNLKDLRSQLVEKSSRLQAGIDDEQILIDSCQEKLREIKAAATEPKPYATKKDQKAIRKIGRKVEQNDKVIKDILIRQSESKELLKQATQLIKNLDDKIANLSEALK
jgi:hypothetical protein